MNRDKMLEAMMKAVTDAVVDVNVEEILAKVYPQIDEKIHETYGFLPEVHEVRTPTATHKICGTTHEKFDEVLNIVNLDIPRLSDWQSGHRQERHLSASCGSSGSGFLLHQRSYAGVQANWLH